MKALKITFLPLLCCLSLWPVYAAEPASDRSLHGQVPVFRAHYDVRINGVRVARAEFSLSQSGDQAYLYKQDSHATGLASWFKREKIEESSLWKLTDNGIQPVLYRYSRKGGSDDREVELVFDWDKNVVENRVAGQPWSMAVPDGTLDKLVMQIAMLMDLRNGKRHFRYPIADGGRLKHFEFRAVEEEVIELPDGRHNTIKLERLDDDRDKTWIWAAPDLQYLPVRFLKKKKSGLKYEIRLRRITTPGDA